MPENNDKRLPESKREGWNAKEIADESTNQMPDEIQRQILRGGETKENADDNDVTGTINSNETPQGREATKKNK